MNKITFLYNWFSLITISENAILGNIIYILWIFKFEVNIHYTRAIS